MPRAKLGNYRHHWAAREEGKGNKRMELGKWKLLNTKGGQVWEEGNRVRNGEEIQFRMGTGVLGIYVRVARSISTTAIK